MKIHQLEICNIASLRGVHQIDFDKLSEFSSLFAITGETGSGKSTILNAIGLAVFGKIYKQSLRHVDLVTLNEKDASIRLTMSVNGIKYLFDNKIRVRKNNGEALSLPKSEKKIYRIDPHDVLTPIETSAEEITGLNFDQFTRAVILNQGEFSKFLHASFRDRKEILEKMYTGDNFENLSERSKTLRDLAKTNVQNLETRLLTLKSPNEDKDGDLEHVIKSNSSFIEKSEKLLNQKIQIHEITKNLIQSIKKHQDYIKNINTSKQDLGLDTTTKNQKSLELQAIIETEKTLHQFIEASLPKLAMFLEQKQSIENQKIKLQDLDIFVRTKKTSLLQFQHKFELENKKLSDSTEKLNSYKINFNVKTEDEFNTYKKTYESLKATLQKKQSQVEQLTQLELELFSTKNNIASSKEERSTLKYQDANLIGQYILDLQNSFQLKLEHDANNIKIKELTPQIQTFKTKLEQIKSDYLQLESEEEEIKLQEKLNSLSSHIETHFLNPSEQCPICEHSLTSEEINLIKKKFTFTQVTKKDFKNLKSILRQTELECDRSLNQAQNTLNQALDSVNNYVSTSASFAEIEELKNHKTKLINLDQLLNTLEHNQKQASQKIQDLKSQIADLDTSIKTQTDFLKKYLVTHNDQYSLAEFEQAINYFNLNMLIKEMTISVSGAKEILSNITNELKEGEVKRENILKEFTELDTYFKNTYKDSDIEFEIKNKRKQLEEIGRNKEVKQKELKDLEHLIGRKESLLYTINENIKQISISFETDKNSLINLASEDELKQKLNLAHIDGEHLFDFFDYYESKIDNDIGDSKHLIASKKEELTRSKTLLEESKKKLALIKASEIELAAARALLARKEVLFQLVGHDELKNYVLSLLEKELITITNIELDRLLNGRYQLIHQTKSERNLNEFFVIDRFKGGEYRKVTTLSGGETFMVSLCMALALSEMSRGKAHIDSFFIDEGFGTLDEDSLQEVLDMLLGLQSRGKMIGLISHVKPLNDRITAKLYLSKNGQGNSRVEYQYH
jgi:exonuclease SbcC